SMAAMAAAVGRLAPETLLALLAEAGQSGEATAFVDGLIGRMTDATVAGFVARHAVSALDTDPAQRGPALDRLAHAFQALVGDPVHRDRLLALAHDEAAASPFGEPERFEDTWASVA